MGYIGYWILDIGYMEYMEYIQAFLEQGWSPFANFQVSDFYVYKLFLSRGGLLSRIFRLTWSHLGSFGLTWAHLVSLGLTWTQGKRERLPRPKGKRERTRKPFPPSLRRRKAAQGGTTAERPRPSNALTHPFSISRLGLTPPTSDI